MWKRLGRRKGQSIVEYLVIITIIIAAIVLVRATVRGNMDTLFSNAAGQTAKAGGSLGSAIPE